MSVVKSKRSEGDLVVLTKARQLATYTIHICSNEKHFPKKYRWCLTSKLVDTAIEIHQNIMIGNAIYVSTQSDYNQRRKYQAEAIAQTYALLSLIDIAYGTFKIESDRVEYWTGLVIEVRNLIRNWKKSDSERYKSIGQ